MMKNAYRKLSIGFLSAMTVLSTACISSGPDYIDTAVICANLNADPVQNLNGLTANFHVGWTANGQTYNSDDYNAPSAKIIGKRACFTGSLGYGIVADDFRLEGFAVDVVDKDGNTLFGFDEAPVARYDEESYTLMVEANVTLYKDAEENAVARKVGKLLGKDKLKVDKGVAHYNRRDKRRAEESLDSSASSKSQSGAARL